MQHSILFFPSWTLMYSWITRSIRNNLIRQSQKNAGAMLVPFVTLLLMCFMTALTALTILTAIPASAGADPLTPEDDPFRTFGLGVDGQILAVESTPNGDLYIGGMISAAGNRSVLTLVRYDGTDWIDFGRAVSPLNYVRDMQLVGDDLYVAFTISSSPSWDNELITSQGTTLNIESGLAIYHTDTDTWSTVTFPNDIQTNINDMTTDGQTLYVAGSAARIWRVNGTAGDTLAPANPRVGWSPATVSPMASALEYHDGKLYIGGRFDLQRYASENVADPESHSQHVAVYDLVENKWGTLGDGFAGSAPILLSSVHALYMADDGILYAGGLMNDIMDGEELIPTNGFARWDGNQWEPLGQGVDPDDNRNRINSIAGHDGKIYVGGRFEYVTQSDGTVLETNNFAVWDPAVDAWETDEYGNAITGSGLKHESLISDFISVGNFYTDNQQVKNMIRSVHVHDGDVYAGGSFDRVALGEDLNKRQNIQNIARYRDGEFYPVGHGVDDVILDVVKVGEEYYMTGLFTFGYNHGDRVLLNGVAKYDPATETFSPLGQGVGRCKVINFSGTACSNYGSRLIFDEESGDLFLGGRFMGGYQSDGTFVESQMAIRWDGTSWQPMGDGLQAGHDIMDYDQTYSEEARWIIDMKQYDGKIYFAGDIQQIDAGAVPGRLAAVWDISEGSWEGIPLPVDYDAYSFRSITITDDEIWFGARTSDASISDRSERYPIVRYDRISESSERFELTSRSSSAHSMVSNIIVDGDFLYIFGEIGLPTIYEDDGEEVRLPSGRLLIHDRVSGDYSNGQLTHPIRSPTDRIFKRGNTFYILNSQYSGRYQTTTITGKEFLTHHMGAPPETVEKEVIDAFTAASPIGDSNLLLTGRVYYEEGDLVKRSSVLRPLDDYREGPVPQFFVEDVEKDVFTSDGEEQEFALVIGNLGNQRFTGSVEVTYQDGDGWLSFGDIDLNAAASGKVSYQVLTEGMEPGTYHAQITVQSGGPDIGDVTLPVVMRVDPLQPPWNPDPVDEQEHVSLNTGLFWEIDHIAEELYVLFGEDPNALQTQANIRYHGDPITEFDTLPDLIPETVYYWQIVVGSDEDGLVFGDIWSFTTAADVVVLATPENEATGVDLLTAFTWYPHEGSDTYRIQIALDDDFTDPLIDSTGIADTSFVLQEPLDPAVYHWRVQGIDGGVAGGWSLVRSFSTEIDPPAPVTLLEPADQAEDVPLDPELSWSQPSDAEFYTVQLALDDQFGQLQLDSTGIADTTLALSDLDHETSYFWRVRAGNEGGVSGWSEIRTFTTVIPTGSEELADIPTESSLDQNYPNPFNPVTQIRFGLPDERDVRLEVYNLLGQRVAILVRERKSAGWHVVPFNAGNLASGVFIYRIQAGDFIQTRQMMLVK